MEGGGALVEGDGLLVPPVGLEQRPEAQVGVEPVGREFDDLLKRLDGAGAVGNFRQGGSEMEIEPGVPGEAGDGRPENLRGLNGFFLSEQALGPVDSRIRRRRFGGDGAYQRLSQSS